MEFHEHGDSDLQQWMSLVSKHDEFKKNLFRYKVPPYMKVSHALVHIDDNVSVKRGNGNKPAE